LNIANNNIMYTNDEIDYLNWLSKFQNKYRYVRIWTRTSANTTQQPKWLTTKQIQELKHDSLLVSLKYNLQILMRKV